MADMGVRRGKVVEQGELDMCPKSCINRTCGVQVILTSDYSANIWSIGVIFVTMHWHTNIHPCGQFHISIMYGT